MDAKKAWVDLEASFVRPGDKKNRMKNPRRGARFPRVQWRRSRTSREKHARREIEALESGGALRIVKLRSKYLKKEE